MTGLRAFPGVVAYNMSRAALDMLTRNYEDVQMLIWFLNILLSTIWMTIDKIEEQAVEC